MITKWKAVQTTWDACNPEFVVKEGSGQFELPEGAQLLGVSPLNHGGYQLITWVEFSAAERVQRAFAVGVPQGGGR